MARILKKQKLVEGIHEFTIEAKDIASKAKAGHFVIVMADETGERIPLTIADSDASAGTITLVVMVVGTSSAKFCALPENSEIHALIGPLGHASEIENYGTVVMVAGGVGAAPIYPIAKALKAAGNKVITIQGARTKDLLFWTNQLEATSDEHIVTTDDGSIGQKALVTEPLKKLLEEDKGKNEIGVVFAIGPAIMMKFCALTTKPFDQKTIVSLNSIMIDGTGMCGGCRCTVKGKNKFTCVDGPEFDGHDVDWDSVMNRSQIYLEQEKASFEQYKCKGGQK